MTLSLVVNLTDITNYAYNEFEAKLSFLALCYNRVSLYIYIYIYIYIEQAIYSLGRDQYLSNIFIDQRLQYRDISQKICKVINSK